MSKKRSNGEGTIIFHKASERYMAQYTKPNGKRGTIYGKTKREVSQKLTKILAEIHSDKYIEPSKKTLIEIMEKVVEDRYESNVTGELFLEQIAAGHGKKTTGKRTTDAAVGTGAHPTASLSLQLCQPDSLSKHDAKWLLHFANAVSKQLESVLEQCSGAAAHGRRTAQTAAKNVAEGRQGSN